jgi:hypothetical protein
MRGVGEISGPIAVMVAVLVGLCGCVSFAVTKRLLDVRRTTLRGEYRAVDPYYIETYLERNRSLLTGLAGDDRYARLLTADRSSPEFERALAATNESMAKNMNAARDLLKLSVLDAGGTVIASTAEGDIGRKEPSTGARGGTSEYAWAMEMRAYEDKDSTSIAVLLPVRVDGVMVGIVKGNLATDVGRGLE